MKAGIRLEGSTFAQRIRDVLQSLRVDVIERAAHIASPRSWNVHRLVQLVPSRATAIRRFAAIGPAGLCLWLARMCIRDVADLAGWLQHSATDDTLLTQLVPAFLFGMLAAYLAVAAWNGRWVGGPIFED